MKLLLSILILTSFLFANANTYKIAITKDMIPFSFIDDNKEPKGILVDYWKLWAKKNNHKIEFVPYLWKDSLEAVKSGKADIHSGLFINDEREEYLDFLEPIISTSSNIYIHENFENINQISDLYGKSLGILEDTYFVSYIKQNYPKINIKTYPSYKELFAALYAKEISSVIEDNITFVLMLMKMDKYGSFQPLDDFELNKFFYAAVNKKDSQIAKLVVDGMKNVTSRDFENVKKKWVNNIKVEYFYNFKKLKKITEEEKKWLFKNDIFLAITDKDEKRIGFNIELLKQINENFNTNMKYKIYSDISTAYEDLKKGEIDGVFTPFEKRNNNELFKQSSSFHYSKYNILTINNKQINSIMDVNVKSIAILDDDDIPVKIVKRIAPNKNIVYVKNIEDLSFKLRAGVADVAIVNNNKKVNYRDLGLRILHYITPLESEFSITLLKEDKNFDNILEKALGTISKNQYEKVLSKWFDSIFTTKELNYIKKQKEIIIGVESWVPILYPGADKKPIGLAGEIVNKAFKTSGLNFKYVVGEWQDLLDLFKEGKIDILPSTAYTDNRATYGLFSDEYLTMRNYIYVEKSTNNVKQLDDLNFKKVAIQKDFASLEILKKNYPNIIIVPTQNLDDSIQKVINKEVDALFELQIAVENKIRNQLLTNLKAVAQNDLKNFSLRVFTKSKDKVLQSIINKSLKNISFEEKNAIINKWLNIEKKKKSFNVAFGIEREPYILNRGYLKGIEYDLIEAVLDKSNLLIKNSKNVSEYALKNVLKKDNSYDISVGLMNNDDELFYSKKFVDFENVAITKTSNNIKIKDVNDIKNMNVTILSKEIYKSLKRSNAMENFISMISLKDFKTDNFYKNSIQDFFNGNSDVLIVDKNIFKWYLKKDQNTNLNDFTFHHIFPEKAQTYVAFKDESLKKIFDQNFEKVLLSGEYENIFSKYLKSDIEAKYKVNILLSSLVSKYLFSNRINAIREIISIYTEKMDYIKKIEVFDIEDTLLAQSSEKRFQNPSIHNSFFLVDQFPQKVGYIKVYFDEKKLLEYSDNLRLVPSDKVFSKLSSHSYIKSVYKRFGYLKQGIEFTRKEKSFISNYPVLKITEINWRPLSIIDNGQFKGIFADYVKLIEDKTGLTFKFIESKTWPEALELFKSGKVDILPASQETLSGMDNRLLSKEFSQFKFAIVSKDDGTFIDGLKDLNGSTIALTKNYTITKIIERNYPKAKILYTNNTKESLQAVSNGEADFAAEHIAIIIHMIKNSFQELKIVGVSDEKLSHHFLINSKHKDLFTIFNKVIANITDEEKDIIKERWAKVEVNTAVDYSVIYKIVAVFSFVLIVVLFFTNKLSNAKIEIEKKNKKIQDTVDTLTQTKEELQVTNSELEVSIDNLKTTQKKLIDSEKMASLGGLVAGVAHEINTPVGIGLTGITHFQELTKSLKKHYDEKEMTQDEFEKYIETSSELSNLIYSNLFRTSELVKSFKQVSVDQTSEKIRTFNLKAYIQEILLSISNVTKKTKHNYIINCEKELVVTTYPGALSQVLTNLIINSIIHGYEEGEKGTIEIYCTKDEHNVKIVYNDDGKGISKDNIKKIFEPFFTTNRQKGGSGLGLNIIYNIITSQMKGSIVCNSEIDKGAEFIIIFHEEQEIV